MTTPAQASTSSINSTEDIRAMEEPQHNVIHAVNAIIAPDGCVPFVHPGRGGTTEVLYDFPEDNSTTRLVLAADGTVALLEAWKSDGEHTGSSEKASASSGGWVNLEGGGLWERVRTAVAGISAAQEEAIGKFSKSRGERPTEVTREGERCRGTVTAKWVRPRGPKNDVFVVRLSPAGEALQVDWTTEKVEG